jgi:long-subunit acyl-CoA synthetase (AMP-forming)
MLTMGFSGSELLDALIFDPVRAATSGKLRVDMNGGSPLAKDM